MTMIAGILQALPEHPTPSLLDPKVGLFVWTAVVFLLVFYILRKYAWGPITAGLEKRQQTIDQSIKRAENALAEARQISQDNERARREAEAGAQRVLREAREAADALRAEEAEKTRMQIREMQEAARTEIEREKQGALDELRMEVAELAIKATEKLLSENLDAAKNRKLVETFIKDLNGN